VPGATDAHRAAPALGVNASGPTWRHPSPMDRSWRLLGPQCSTMQWSLAFQNWKHQCAPIHFMTRYCVVTFALCLLSQYSTVHCNILAMHCNLYCTVLDHPFRQCAGGQLLAWAAGEWLSITGPGSQVCACEAFVHSVLCNVLHCTAVQSVETSALNICTFCAVLYGCTCTV